MSVKVQNVAADGSVNHYTRVGSNAACRGGMGARGRNNPAGGRTAGLRENVGGMAIQRPVGAVIGHTDFGYEGTAMRVGIIGVGNIGGTLTRRFAGHDVFVANSRRPETLEDLTGATGARAVAVVMRLVDELGFDPVDAGRLDESWRQQPGTPVYGADFDAPGVRKALSEASKERTPEWSAS